MSQGTSCKCGEHKKPPAQRRWVVLQRYCNYSAFSGYRYTPSDYSCLQCHVCGTVWRTKAAYVSTLPNGSNLYDQPPHNCGSCAHMRLRTPKDKPPGQHHNTDTHWCPKLGQPTVPNLCRCGGDDFQAKPVA